jgi:hypothetical protein
LACSDEETTALEMTLGMLVVVNVDSRSELIDRVRDLDNLDGDLLVPYLIILYA